MKVLVAEDDPDQLAVRGLLLAQRGFDVLKAADAASALQLARDQQPRCAVVDLGLPSEEIGLQLIRDLRNLPQAPEVIVFTGLSPTRARRNRALDGLVCLEKGDSSVKFLAAVERACGEGPFAG